MTLAEFQSFVEQNATWFQGVHPETVVSLQTAEEQIDSPLPPSLKWLLCQWGYSGACGIGAVDDAVTATLRCRHLLHLPEQYVILNDWGDGGVVFLDTTTTDDQGECKVFWVGQHSLTRLADGQGIGDDGDVFDGYPAWVQFRLEEVQQENF